MGFPFPPTDSLYKFCSIVGTLLVVLSLYALAYLHYDYDEKLELDLKALTIANAELGFVEARVDQIIAIEKRNSSSTIKAKTKVLSGDNSQYTQKDIDALDLEMITHRKDIHIKKADLDYLQSRIKMTELYLKLVTGISCMTILLGLILSIYGYSRWYTRIQKYSDEAIKQSTEQPKKISARLTRRSS